MGTTISKLQSSYESCIQQSANIQQSIDSLNVQINDLSNQISDINSKIAGIQQQIDTLVIRVA